MNAVGDVSYGSMLGFACHRVASPLVPTQRISVDRSSFSIAGTVWRESVVGTYRRCIRSTIPLCGHPSMCHPPRSRSIRSGTNASQNYYDGVYTCGCPRGFRNHVQRLLGFPEDHLTFSNQLGLTRYQPFLVFLGLSNVILLNTLGLHRSREKSTAILFPICTQQNHVKRHCRVLPQK
jgi:hypothetical protein